MLRIDKTLLQEVGLGSLPDNEKNSLLKHIYETLEMRVGIRLADQMTNEQLDEFERYFEAKDDAGAFKWLETNFPNYKDIVQEEFDKLKSEVAQTAPQILTSSQTQVDQSPVSQPQVQNATTTLSPESQPKASILPSDQRVPAYPPQPQDLQAIDPSAIANPQLASPTPLATHDLTQQSTTQIPQPQYQPVDHPKQQPPFPDEQPPAGPPAQ
jgi:Tfp pilus assembly protein PilE